MSPPTRLEWLWRRLPLLRIPLKSDLLSGLLFIVSGSGFMLLSSGYELGTAVTMGPGYFPMVLGGGVIIVGAILVIKSLLPNLHADEDLTVLHVRPGLFVLGGMLLFAVSLKLLGILFAAGLLVLLSSLATRELRLVEVIISAIVLAVFSALVFVFALGVPMPIWPQVM